MVRVIALSLAFVLVLAAPSPAQDVSLLASCSESDGFLVCRYVGNLANTKNTEVFLSVDERVQFRSHDTALCATTFDRAGSAVTCKPKAGGKGQFEFELMAFAKEFIPETEDWGWKQDGSRQSGGKVPVPAAAYDPAAVRPMFGGGATLLFDDSVQFHVKDGRLLVLDDSSLRASALVGVMFTLTEWKGRFQRPHPISAFVSLEFAEGTTKVLDGFLFGVGLDLTPYLSLVTGYSLTRGQELSPGFKREAERVVQGQISAKNQAYSVYEGLESDPKRYDGLPLAAPGATAPFFGGDPIIESFNSSWHVGFVIPVNLKKLLQ